MKNKNKTETTLRQCGENSRVYQGEQDGYFYVMNHRTRYDTFEAALKAITKRKESQWYDRPKANPIGVLT